ncbi:hypothetical protein AYL99_00338 [Fonsecaea erecta]|uniref:Uncharacterized protein n=1 Tax=Fonsecaea erecta TaxID=1367422 RepID=A0A178ZY51_9EURO|nr:hypothetical protein AYL99_00338 [Fonsecaea erecta]OAP64366.1 hypothetical protein AYL99_00338 [Fonsecaea erecta]
MAKPGLRPRWTGGDSRSSGWFGLAKMLMPDEYRRIDAIRKNRRDRVRAAALNEKAIEDDASSIAGTRTANPTGTDEEEEPHAEETEEAARDAEDDFADVGRASNVRSHAGSGQSNDGCKPQRDVPSSQAPSVRTRSSTKPVAAKAFDGGDQSSQRAFPREWAAFLFACVGSSFLLQIRNRRMVRKSVQSQPTSRDIIPPDFAVRFPNHQDDQLTPSLQQT